MKKVLIIILYTIIILGLNIDVYAEDFYTINNGDTIYYNITSKTYPYTVEVTFKLEKYDSYCQYSGSITIPEEVIYDNITYKVTAIGQSAFQDCIMLNSISIPKTVISINHSAFNACSGLKSVIIPNSVNHICSYAFYACNGLESVILSKSISVIGISVFEDCRSLISIEIPNSVVSIENSAFRGCISLSKIVIPNSVVLIKESAFRYCKNLESISLPNSLTKIGNSAFRNCQSISTISFPNYITHIGLFAFENCKNLKSIICYSINPPRIYSTTFDEVKTDIPIKVPCGSESQYQNAINWSNFTNIRINDTNNIKGEICEGETYKLNGFKVSKEGKYTLKLKSNKGCDSILSLELNVNPKLITNFEQEICEGETYNQNGFNASKKGIYSLLYKTYKGCDSLINLALKVNKPKINNIEAEICDGEIYSLNGFNKRKTGIYTQKLQTNKGCDSIVNLSLKVNKPAKTYLEAEICEKETYSLNGFSLKQSGTYMQILQTYKGCDSTVELRLKKIQNPIPTNLHVQLLPQNIEVSWIGNGESYQIYRNNGYLATINEPYFYDQYTKNDKKYCYKVKSIIKNCISEYSYTDCRYFFGYKSEEDNGYRIQLHYILNGDEIQLEFVEIDMSTEIVLYDYLRRILNKYTLSPHQTKLSIDVSKFTYGIYNIRIEDRFQLQNIYFLFSPNEGIKEINNIP